MRVAITGLGNIGNALYKRVLEFGWKVPLILKADGVYKNPDQKIDVLKNYKKYCKNLDLAFLTIPTVDDGLIAYNYLKFFLSNDIPVVTCEKGAFSNYFPELKKWKDKIGYSAAVGGGTRLLRFLEDRTGTETEGIHAVINGTLNYIFEELSLGKELSKSVTQVQQLGYAEPYSCDPFQLIIREAEFDIPMKAAIIFNIGGFASKNLLAKEIKIKKISKPAFKKLIKESRKRRYIISISRKANLKNIIGGFHHKIGEWNIYGGFRDIKTEPIFKELFIKGMNNKLIISEEIEGKLYQYELSGPGAGREPTVSAMIKDALKLKKK